MASTPLVSIGILSYNRPDDLGRAIDSVLAQTYTNLEILISDNGSLVEKTRNVIAAYAAKDARIKTFLHELNKGPQFNFGFLVQQARGKYFSWLADDDAYSPNCIEDSVSVLESNDSIVLATNMPVVAGTNHSLDPKYVPHTVGLSLFHKYELTIRYIFEDINLFYYGLIRLDVLRCCNLYLKRLFGSDQLLPLELLAFGDIAINRDKPGYIYTVHANQTSSSSLRYRQVTLQQDADLIERRAFFTAYIYYMIRLVRRRSGLRSGEKSRLIREILRQFIATKRFHLLKYDMGLNGIVSFFKKASK